MIDMLDSITKWGGLEYIISRHFKARANEITGSDILNGSDKTDLISFRNVIEQGDEIGFFEKVAISGLVINPYLIAELSNIKLFSRLNKRMPSVSGSDTEKVKIRSESVSISIDRAGESFKNIAPRQRRGRGHFENFKRILWIIYSLKFSGATFKKSTINANSSGPILFINWSNGPSIELSDRYAWSGGYLIKHKFKTINLAAPETTESALLI